MNISDTQLEQDQAGLGEAENSSNMGSRLRKELKDKDITLEETRKENRRLRETIDRLREELVLLESAGYSVDSVFRGRTSTFSGMGLSGSPIFGSEIDQNAGAQGDLVFATGSQSNVQESRRDSSAGLVGHQQQPQRQGPSSGIGIGLGLGKTPGARRNALASGVATESLGDSSSTLSRLSYFVDLHRFQQGVVRRQGSTQHYLEDGRKQQENILIKVRHRRYSLARERRISMREVANHRFGGKSTPTELARGDTTTATASGQGRRSATPPTSPSGRSVGTSTTAPSSPSNSVSSSTVGADRGGLNEAILLDPTRGALYHLPRGGVYVQTSKCAVQFGIPPETIKDSLSQGLQVPTYYVVPKERFNLKLGLNMCEVEFPAYFNYFLQNLSVNLLVTPEVEEIVRKVVDETLEGPIPEHLYADREYPEQTPKRGRFAYAARPNHVNEINFFKEPRNGNEICTEKLVNFIHFLPHDQLEDEDEIDGNNTEGKSKAQNKDGSSTKHRAQTRSSPRGNAIIRSSSAGNGDAISGANQHNFNLRKKSSGQLHHRTNLEMNESGVENTGDHQSEESTCGSEEPSLIADLGNGIKVEDLGQEYVVWDDGVELARIPSFLSAWAPQTLPGSPIPQDIVDPPTFGITVLGSSHGFDKQGSTSGFVLWMHKKGIMVDPPPNATEILQRSGIIPSMITGVILTHCHADHDAGTFQKILKEGRITLITTKTIFDSFIRKYSIISGFAEGFLLKLFEHRFVKIGELVHWHGGTLRFFYSLHALPCIGFEAFVGRKSFVYSADTYYEPNGLKKLYEGGYLTKERYEGLMDFPWDYDVVLHEAGIAPIHTPFSVLQQLPEDVKKNLYIIHITEERARESGLRLAKAGIENTIVIDTEPNELSSAASILQLLRSTDIFKHFTMSQAGDLLQLSREYRYKAGEYICHKGQEAEHLYVILSGFCAVEIVEENLIEETTSAANKEQQESIGDDDNNSSSGDNEENATDYSKLGRHTSSDYDQIWDLRGHDSSSSIDVSTSYANARRSDDGGNQYIPARKVFSAGDYLGEMALLNNMKRSASIVALTRVSLIKLNRHAFRYLLDTTPGLEHRMERLARIRCSMSWLAIDANSVFCRLGSTQRSQLQAIMQPKFVKAGEVLWRKNSPVSYAYLVANGQLEFVEMREELDTPFETGAFLCNVTSMMSQRAIVVAENENQASRSTLSGRTEDGEALPNPSSFSTTTNNDGAFGSSSTASRSSSSARGVGKRNVATSRVTLVAKTDCHVYYIESDDILEFLDQNPGIFINLIDSLVME